MRIKILLIIILILGSVLRLTSLAKFPVGISADEVGQGYSAYSILKTGMDEWGERLPLFPRGFGDYKPPLYTYLTIPSVALFDLNEFSVRLPAAILGILTILFVYLLVFEWFSKKDYALWAAFLTAISPWHIQLSRTAFEGNAGVLFFVIGLWSYFKARSNTAWIYLSAVCFGLTLYSYHSYKLFTPLFVLMLLILDRKILKSKKIILFLAILALFALPQVINLTKSSTRLTDVSIISQLSPDQVNSVKFESSAPVFLKPFFDNKLTLLADKFVNNYFSYFSLQFFFTGSRPDNSYLNFPYTPLVYLVELISILSFLIFVRKHNHYKLSLIFAWFLLAPIPASLATDSASANRVVTFVPLLSIISSIGLVNFLNFFESKVKVNKRYLESLTVLVFGVFLITFLYQYLFHVPFKKVDSLRSGYKQVFTEIIKREDFLDGIVISHSFSEPQIYVAFYKKLDPVVYQQASKDWLRYELEGKTYLDQLGIYNLGKYQFRDVAWNDDRLRKNYIFAGGFTEFPKDINPIVEIKDKTGRVYFKVVSPEGNSDKKI